MTYSLYCKEIHFFYEYQKYVIKYYGITSNFENRKVLYETNNKQKTTFIQSSIKEGLQSLDIPFVEFPIYLVENNLKKEDAEIKELYIVLRKREENDSNTIVFGSFFTFPKIKFTKSENKINFLKTFNNDISQKLQNFTFDELKELYSLCKSAKKMEIINYLQETGFNKKEIGEIIIGYGGFCYLCKEERHLQRNCQLWKNKKKIR